jgi:hypothetical protein
VRSSTVARCCCKLRKALSWGGASETAVLLRFVGAHPAMAIFQRLQAQQLRVRAQLHLAAVTHGPHADVAVRMMELAAVVPAAAIRRGGRCLHLRRRAVSLL